MPLSARRDPRAPVARTRRASEVKSNRWSPGSGLHATGSRFEPSSTCSPTVSPSRSTTRNASCTMSPCSACRRQIKRPSAESPPVPAGSSRPTPMGARLVRMSLGASGGGDEVRAVVLLRAEPERDLARSPRTRSPGASPSGDRSTRGRASDPSNGGGHPSPGLVPDVVLPPHDPSVRRDQRFFDPDRLVRDPAPRSGAQVRRPGLPGAVLVRREREMVWGAVDPGREARSERR